MANPTVIKLRDGNVMPQLGWVSGRRATRKSLRLFIKRWKWAIDQSIPRLRIKMKKASAKHLKVQVSPENLFITTKLWNDDQKRPREALLESLEKLQLDYLDLWLMHWPVPAIDHYVEARKGMIDLQKRG